MNSYNKLKLKYNTALEDLNNLSKTNSVKSEKYISKQTSRLTREKSSIIKWRNALDLVESVEYSSYSELIRIFQENKNRYKQAYLYPIKLTGFV